MHQISDEVNRKFTDIIDLDNWEIDTPSGWRNISAVMKTVEYDKWRVDFDDGLWIECADDHILMTRCNIEVFAKDLLVGDEVYSTLGVSRVTSVQPLGYKEEMYDVEVDSNEHVYYSNGLVSHNTTTVGAYILHKAVFNKHLTIGILANKGDTARGILARIKDMFEYLPWFLKPGVIEWNKGRIELSNGTKIISAATSAGGVRSYSMNCVSGDTLITVEDDGKNISTVPIKETYANLSKYKYRYINTDKGETTMFSIGDETLTVPTSTRLKNKYEKTYYRIIEKALSENRTTGKYEKHHIQPMSISKDNSESNIVKLTLREHFVCHKLLVKMYSGPDKCKMLKALYMMSNTRGLTLPSRVYEQCKRNLSEESSKRMKAYLARPEVKARYSALCSKTMLGVPKTEIQRIRISKSNTGKIHYWQDKINKNPEKIRKTAEKHTGMKRSDITRHRQSEARKASLIKNGSAIVGLGKFYIYNTETQQIKRVDSLDNLASPWIPGNGPSKSKNTFFIRNSETGQIRKVPLGTAYEYPWYKGMK